MLSSPSFLNLMQAVERKTGITDLKKKMFHTFSLNGSAADRCPNGAFLFTHRTVTTHDTFLSEQQMALYYELSDLRPRAN